MWFVKKIVVALVCMLAITSCGFKLRGETTLPFRYLSVEGSKQSTILARLERELGNVNNVSLVTTPADAEVRVILLFEDKPARTVIGYDSNGKENAFRLTRSARFRFTNASGRDLSNIGEFVQRRDINVSADTELAKEGEGTMLEQDMEKDLVAQVILRIKTLRTSD